MPRGNFTDHRGTANVCWRGHIKAEVGTVKGTKGFCAACASINAKARRAQKDDPIQIERKRRMRIANRMRLYGITAEEYDALFVIQGGKCAICKRPPSPTKGLALDHPHDGGRRHRGLLCDSCNQALGRFQDNPNLLIAAAEYLWCWTQD